MTGRSCLMLPFDLKEVNFSSMKIFLKLTNDIHISNPMLRVFMAVYSILLNFLCLQTGDENDKIYIFRAL